MGAPSAAELFELPVHARAVIICAEYLGFSHATTAGVTNALRSGPLNSARVMAPAPWVRAAVNLHRGEDTGLSVVLNAHHPILHCPPITFAPTLLDGTGGLPATPEELWEHGDLDEVHREVRSQIERSIAWGFDVSHLASHLDIMVKRPEFFDIFIDAAIEFAVPLSFDPRLNESTIGFPATKLARDEGIPTPDAVVSLRELDINHRSQRDLEIWLDENLGAGITELTMAPGIDTPELHDLFADWEYFVSDLSLLTTSTNLTQALKKLDIKTKSYRELRDRARLLGVLPGRKVSALG